jgi:hypothetical protein
LPRENSVREISQLDAAVTAIPLQARQRAALEAAVVLDELLKLARDLRTPGAYVGYSAFVLFALSFGVRPYMWEGTERIDIVEVFAPHLLER